MNVDLFGKFCVIVSTALMGIFLFGFIILKLVYPGLLE